MPSRNRFTLGEWVQLVITADRLRREVDADLGDLVERVAHGDDAALPLVYDRLAACGRFDAADRIRRVAGPRP